MAKEFQDKVWFWDVASSTPAVAINAPGMSHKSEFHLKEPDSKQQRQHRPQIIQQTDFKHLAVRARQTQSNI